MADSEHNVKIKINGNAGPAVGAFGKVVSSLKNVRAAASNVMSAFGVFGMAMNGVNMLVEGLKWLRDKITETAREMAKLRFDIVMRAAASETARLVGFHERLSNLLKEELDTLAKQREIQDIEAYGKKDAEDGKREADRARQIFEAKTPEEEQALRDKFEAEDEQRSRDERKKARKSQIKTLDEEESVYTSKANGLRNNNAAIDKRIKDEEFDLLRATNEEDKKAIRSRIDALNKRKEANEAEIEQFKKEAKFRRDKIDALENQKDYEGPTAGEWKRKTEAKKRAEESAMKEAEKKASEEKYANDKAARDEEAKRREEIRNKEEQTNDLELFADRIDAADGVSQNRLTAMGLGSGVSAKGDVSSDVRKLVDLMRQQIAATKENRQSGGDNVSVFGE